MEMRTLLLQAIFKTEPRPHPELTFAGMAIDWYHGGCFNFL